MNVPKYWHDDGTTLWSPPDVPGEPEVPIVGVIRDYLLNLPAPWPYGNVALCAQYEAAQLEENDEKLGGGIQQPFRYAVLNVPASGEKAGQVLFGWGVRTLVFVRALLAQAWSDLAGAQEENASLQKQLAAVLKKKQSGIAVDTVINRMTEIEDAVIALTKKPF